MKKILLLILLAFVSYSVVGEPTGPSKKCPICGQPIPKCKYKGKHPNPATQTTTDTKRKQEAEAKRKAEAEAKRKREAEAKHRQETAAKQRQEAEAQRKRSANMINGHEWVDLGLSVKWATCNVGADSPSDYGDYFAWGETKPKATYDFSNCFDCLRDKGDMWEVYKLGGKTQISPNSGHDAARQNWGGTWRMPTAAELEELKTKCKWTWTTKNGHNGNEITGPNGNSIFLPATGKHAEAEYDGYGTYGYYWSSTLSSGFSNAADYLHFYNDSYIKMKELLRRCGLTIRPVSE